MNSCIFCSIIKGEKPGHILYQNQHSIALLDIFPSVEGHTMIVPKKHGVTILDFSAKELGEIFETVKKMASVLEKAYNTKALTIGINHGEESGVPHLHVHIIPRSKGDGGGIIQTVVKKNVKADPNKVVEKIKEKIT